MSNMPTELDWRDQFRPTKDKILGFIREETQLRPVDKEAPTVTLKEIMEISGVGELTTRKYVMELVDEGKVQVMHRLGGPNRFYAVLE